jgi:plasmid replication initiation protein
VDELKKKLDCEKYPRFSNFKQTVLDIAIKEINDFTDLYVDYKLEKIESRSYNRITFYLQSKWENYVEYLEKD